MERVTSGRISGIKWDKVRVCKQRWRCEGGEVEGLQLKGDKAAAAQEDNS